MTFWEFFLLHRRINLHQRQKKADLFIMALRKKNEKKAGKTLSQQKQQHCVKTDNLIIYTILFFFSVNFGQNAFFVLLKMAATINYSFFWCFGRYFSVTHLVLFSSTIFRENLIYQGLIDWGVIKIDKNSFMFCFMCFQKFHWNVFQIFSLLIKAYH